MKAAHPPNEAERHAGRQDRMSSDEKSAILNAFTGELNLSKREAAALLVSSAYLLGTGAELHKNLGKVLEPSLPNFTRVQADSAMEMLESLCKSGTTSLGLKREFVDGIRTRLMLKFAPKGKWA